MAQQPLTPQSYVSIVPLGKLSITAAGTTTLLSANCGPLQGQIATQANPNPVPGSRIRQFWLQAAVTNTGSLYLLPRGKTFSANPEAVILQIGVGGGIPFPYGLMSESFLPENYCFDTDAVSGTQVAYGYGVIG